VLACFAAKMTEHGLPQQGVRAGLVAFALFAEPGYHVRGETIGVGERNDFADHLFKLLPVRNQRGEFLGGVVAGVREAVFQDKGVMPFAA
jgi:hypothetical protein